MKLSERVKKWREKNPEKHFCHKLIERELRAGKLKRKRCFCGKTKVEAHHDDYSKPLKINWLCKKHHVEADKKRRLNPVDKMSYNFTKKYMEKNIKKVRKVYYLTKEQAKWVKQMARKRKVTESEIIREVIGIAYPTYK